MAPKLSDGTPLSFRQDNPKRAGTKAHERFERYKAAKTLGEALQLGAVRADITNDIKQGLCRVLDVDAPAAVAAAAPLAASRCPGEPAAAAPAAKRPRSQAAVAVPVAALAAPAAAAAAPARAAAAPAAAAPAGVAAGIVAASSVAADAAAAPAASVPSEARAVAAAEAAAGGGSAASSSVPAAAAAAVAAPSVAAAGAAAVASGGPRVAAVLQKYADVDLSFATFDRKPAKYCRRVMGEAKRLLSKQGLEDGKRDGYAFTLLDRGSLSKWLVRISDLNADGKLAKDLVKLDLDKSIDLEVSLPENFPLEPPFVRVTYPQLTGGYVFSHGGICFEPLTAKGWAPSMTLPSLAIAIKGILDYGDVRVAGAGNRSARTVPHYTEEGARKDHKVIVSAHRGGESASYGSLKHYSS